MGAGFEVLLSGLEVEARRERVCVHIHKGSDGSCAGKKILSECLPWWVATGREGAERGRETIEFCVACYKSMLS